MDVKCRMSGHPLDCPGFGSKEHADYIREGRGVSTVPGPNDQELLEEMRSDVELMRDEFHGREV